MNYCLFALNGIFGVTKYQKIKIVRRIKKNDNRIWVDCIFENGTIWIPSFAQLSIIINEIGYCEDINYIENPNAMGHEMPRRFFNDILKNGYMTKEQLIICLEQYDKYSKMPIRKQFEEINIVTKVCNNEGND